VRPSQYRRVSLGDAGAGYHARGACSPKAESAALPADTLPAAPAVHYL